MTGTTTSTASLGLFAEPLRQAPHPGPGRLITVDGVDGSGKSTLVGAVTDHLRRSGLDAHPVDLMSPWVRRHPQFKLLAEDLANVVERRADITSLCALCIGDRLATWRTQARARVLQGTWLVVDRYNLTPMSDMLVLRSEPADQVMVRSLLDLLPRPDLALVTEVPPEVAVDRVWARPDEAHKRARPQLTRSLVSVLSALADVHGVLGVDTSGDVDSALGGVIPALDRLR